MAGRQYAEEAYRIRLEFEDMASSVQEQWKDDQANRFKYGHLEEIDRALLGIELPIEKIVDLVDSKLEEIRNISNG